MLRDVPTIVAAARRLSRWSNHKYSPAFWTLATESELYVNEMLTVRRFAAVVDPHDGSHWTASPQC